MKKQYIQKGVVFILIFLCLFSICGCDRMDTKVQEMSTESEKTDEDIPSTEEAEAEDCQEAEDSQETDGYSSNLPEILEETSEKEVEEPDIPVYSYVEISEVMYVSNPVNVRNLPSKTGEKIGSMAKNQEVTVTGQCNETSWYRINYNGVVGYVSNKYLVEEKLIENSADTPQPTEQPAEQSVEGTTEQPTEESALVSIKNLLNRKSLQKKCTDEELQQAYDVAAQIVTPLVGLSKEEQLTGIAVALRSMVDSGQIMYSTEIQHYNDPYGYLVLGVASCAGCARTTGLCLNMLGIPYEHVNEGEWSHQWCRVNINGTYWICDAFGLYVGPEPAPYEHPYLE